MSRIFAQYASKAIDAEYDRAKPSKIGKKPSRKDPARKAHFNNASLKTLFSEGQAAHFWCLKARCRLGLG